MQNGSLTVSTGALADPFNASLAGPYDNLVDWTDVVESEMLLQPCNP